jgi:hypothetical protein
MFPIYRSVGITSGSSIIREPIYVGYLHGSNRKKGYAWMCFTVKNLYIKRQDLVLTIDSDKPSRQKGSNPTILEIESPGKIISLTMIKTGCDTDGNNVYNLLVFYTEGDENNPFMTVFRISYDFKTYMQPSMYVHGHYTCLRWISTISLICEPIVHFAQQVEIHSFCRKFPLHPIRNNTSMKCYKRVLLRLKTYGQILPFLIERLISSCGTFSHNKKVQNKIKLSMVSKVFNMMLYMQILKLE